LPAGNNPVKDIVVHRTNILRNLIEEFKSPDVLQYQLNVAIMNERGDVEIGRGSGVLREVISLLWHNLFTSLTIGALEKVPSVRHDYQRAEWEAIGRILVYGYLKVQYFPVEISRVFMACCLFGEDSGTESLLSEAFELYVASDEVDVLRKCKEGNINPNDEDLLDLLSTYKCYKVPNKENISCIISQLAHQELIQKPKYISNCWKEIIAELKRFPELRSAENMMTLYETKKPTGKKVMKLLQATPTNDSERNSFEHLKVM